MIIQNYQVIVVPGSWLGLFIYPALSQFADIITSTVALSLLAPPNVQIVACVPNVAHFYPIITLKRLLKVYNSFDWLKMGHI